MILNIYKVKLCNNIFLKNLKMIDDLVSFASEIIEKADNVKFFTKRCQVAASILSENINQLTKINQTKQIDEENLQIIKDNLSLYKEENEEEINAKLICGINFDCQSWKSKYTKDSLYQFAYCKKVDNEICLFASNKEMKPNNTNKKPLSTGAIVGIVIAVIAVIVVMVVIIAIVVTSKKKKGYAVEILSNSNENSIEI